MVGDGSVTVDVWEIEADGSRRHVPCQVGCVDDSTPQTLRGYLSGYNWEMGLSDLLPYDEQDDVGHIVQTGTFVVAVTIGGHTLPQYTLSIVH
jgi:hypothetical protein